VADQTTEKAAPLRLDIPEAAARLRISRATLYQRIAEGKIHAHKDGARTFVTHAELERYVARCSQTQQSS
jgi:excisionase family DNA binding protein